MDIFQRTIHSNVKRLDDDRVLVTSQLLDLEHSFHLELTVRLSDGVIEKASAVMSRAPFGRCLPAVEAVGSLVGLAVERGILAKINEAMGGARGCAHLVELVSDAARLIAMIRLGDAADYGFGRKLGLSEEEAIERSRERLRNSCVVFADEA